MAEQVSHMSARVAPDLEEREAAGGGLLPLALLRLVRVPEAEL